MLPQPKPLHCCCSCHVHHLAGPGLWPWCIRTATPGRCRHTWHVSAVSWRPQGNDWSVHNRLASHNHATTHAHLHQRCCTGQEHGSRFPSHLQHTDIPALPVQAQALTGRVLQCCRCCVCLQVRFGPWSMADGETPNVGPDDCAALKKQGYDWIFSQVSGVSRRRGAPRSILFDLHRKQPRDGTVRCSEVLLPQA